MIRTTTNSQDAVNALMPPLLNCCSLCRPVSSVAAVAAQPPSSSSPAMLDSETNALLSSSMGFMASSLAPAASTQQGISSLPVASFVNTFLVPTLLLNTAV